MEPTQQQVSPQKVVLKGGAEREQQAIEAMLKGFEAAFNKYDAKEVASFFLADATLYNPEGKYADGKQQIEQVVKSDLSRFLKGAKNSFKLLNVRLLGPELALVDMAHVAESAALPGGKLENHVDAVMRKDLGQWRILDARPRPFMKP
jgi:uncharacterized protein (TIGR02246 family)